MEILIPLLPSSFLLSFSIIGKDAVECVSDNYAVSFDAAELLMQNLLNNSFIKAFDKSMLFSADKHIYYLPVPLSPSFFPFSFLLPSFSLFLRPLLYYFSRFLSPLASLSIFLPLPFAFYLPTPLSLLPSPLFLLLSLSIPSFPPRRPHLHVSNFPTPLIVLLVNHGARGGERRRTQWKMGPEM